MRPLVAHCHLGLGQLYRQAGNRPQWQDHLGAAVTLYRDLGMSRWLAMAESAAPEGDS
jgi:hypothetical protein